MTEDVNLGRRWAPCDPLPRNSHAPGETDSSFCKGRVNVVVPGKGWVNVVVPGKGWVNILTWSGLVRRIGSARRCRTGLSMQRSRCQSARRLYHDRQILSGVASREFRFFDAAA